MTTTLGNAALWRRSAVARMSLAAGAFALLGALGAVAPATGAAPQGSPYIMYVAAEFLELALGKEPLHSWSFLFMPVVPKVIFLLGITGLGMSDLFSPSLFGDNCCPAMVFL